MPGRATSSSAAGAPVVVQSMTNTDTADAAATARPGGRARRGRLGDRPHHGQQPRRGGAGGRDPRPPARRARRRGAAGRRLPLQRPHAAARVPRLRRRPRQVPHQPGQRGPRRPPRRELRDDGAGGDRPRPAGADRRQRRIARPRAARRADGRERAPAPSPLPRRRGAARGDGAERDHLRRGGRGARPARRPDRPLVQDQPPPGHGRRLPRPGRRAARTRCTSGSPRPGWAARASSRPPPPSASCSRTASATRSARASPRSPAATARSRCASAASSSRASGCAPSVPR